MGARGPAPKRSTQRRRTNDNASVEQVVVSGEVYGQPLEGQHSAPVRRFWEALRASGQAQFYEPSDWAYAEVVVIPALKAFLKRPSAMMLASLNSAMSSLLVTEADRRRVRLELERAQPDAPADEHDATVVRMDGYRDRFAG